MQRDRQQRRDDGDGASAQQPLRCGATAPLLDALRPVLPLFHSLLADADAARLLRTSRSTALALLPGYTFTTHIFQILSTSSLRCLRDLGLVYGLRISQLVLGPNVKVFGFDTARLHQSPFPSTLTSLRIGYYRAVLRFISHGHSYVEQEQRWAALSAAACHWQHTGPWQLPHSHPQTQAHGSEGQQWQQLPWSELSSSLQCSLPPGLLPCGLRVLQLNTSFNQPLEVGSLPSTLTYLEFGEHFNQPLPAGVLPASLLHLQLGTDYSQPLGQGSLPVSLERLILRSESLSLSALVLPLSVRALHLPKLSEPLPPHVLPSSLLYLALHDYRHPIVAGALPSSLIHLDLGGYPYASSLSPGLLPSSLRDLSVGGFAEPLQPGALPEGLLFLRLLCHNGRLPAVPPGALPSTLLGLDLGGYYRHPLPAGVVPHSVQWVRLGPWYRDGRIEAVLPAHTERRVPVD